MVMIVGSWLSVHTSLLRDPSEPVILYSLYHTALFKEFIRLALGPLSGFLDAWLSRRHL